MSAPRPTLTREPRRLTKDEALACGMGQGAACCVFLVADALGFECQQRGPLRNAIRARVEQMTSKRTPEGSFPACQTEGVGRAMKTVLIVDTETTGTDPEKDQAIEVGAILYSVEHASVVECYSALIQVDENPAENVNRIPSDLLREHGRSPDDAWAGVESLAIHAEAFLAHNAEFDRRFAPPAVRDFLPWICTQSDLAWPLATKSGQALVGLALDHGLCVLGAHRALTDCFLIARLLTRCAELGHDLVAMLQRGLRPKVLLHALVSYDDREKAKAAGFRWDPESRRWLRRMVKEDAADLGFPVRVIGDEVAR